MEIIETYNGRGESGYGACMSEMQGEIMSIDSALGGADAMDGEELREEIEAVPAAAEKKKSIFTYPHMIAIICCVLFLLALIHAHFWVWLSKHGF